MYEFAFSSQCTSKILTVRAHFQMAFFSSESDVNVYLAINIVGEWHWPHESISIHWSMSLVKRVENDFLSHWTTKIASASGTTWPDGLTRDTLSCSHFKRIDKRSNLLANKWNSSIIDPMLDGRSLSHSSLKHPVIFWLRDSAHRFQFVNDSQRQSNKTSIGINERRSSLNDLNVLFSLAFDVNREI